MSSDEKIYGIDIGGANIKLSCLDGKSVAVAFPMWTDYDKLGETVVKLLQELDVEFDEACTLAVTMTGEMADCFFSRREGVAAILDGLTGVIPEHQCQVYAVGGQWMDVQQSKQRPWDVAASNWYALVSWLLTQRHWSLDRCSAVLDIGSTTVDIIPIANDQIATEARTDRDRMQLGQLVYTGMERTPIHAIVDHLLVDGVRCPVMAERFATSVDVHLVLRTANEEPDNCDTADGRPRTRVCALARLARMVGEDSETLSEAAIVSLAQQILDAQASQVAKALARNLQAEPARVVVAIESNEHTSFQLTSLGKTVFVTGHGRPLVDRLRTRPELKGVQFEMLEDRVNSAASRCAPALAVAQLWQQQAKLRAGR